MEGKEPQLRAFALLVSQEIKSHWPQVAAGLILQGVVDKWRWTFGKVPEWEIEDNTPTQGLKFTYIGAHYSAAHECRNIPRRLTACCDRN